MRIGMMMMVVALRMTMALRVIMMVVRCRPCADSLDMMVMAFLR